MPQIFRIGSYVIYFWTNENEPREPIHVHIAEGRATPNATKVWITSSGRAVLCNNNFNISAQRLKNLMRFVEANSKEIVEKWTQTFGEISYYC